MSDKTYITVEALINAPIEKVWEYWTKPEHITHWNFASKTWCCPTAQNDLKTGGRFSYRMESRDGRVGFDFGGVYTAVEPNQKLSYTIGDGRTVDINFSSEVNGTKIVEVFEAEKTNSVNMQLDGWQSILNNFKQYVENK